MLLHYWRVVHSRSFFQSEAIRIPAAVEAYFGGEEFFTEGRDSV